MPSDLTKILESGMFQMLAESTVSGMLADMFNNWFNQNFLVGIIFGKIDDVAIWDRSTFSNLIPILTKILVIGMFQSRCYNQHFKLCFWEQTIQPGVDTNQKIF